MASAILLGKIAVVQIVPLIKYSVKIGTLLNVKGDSVLTFCELTKSVLDIYFSKEIKNVRFAY